VSIKSIAADLAIAPTRPKGIKVSVETWQEMKKLGLIEMKGVAAWGVFDLGYEMPFYDGDICVIVDPELELSGLDYLLPPCAKA
jgi:hypothetical protein